MSNKKGDAHYVDNHVFRRLLEEYYESDEMTDELAVNVKNIAIGLSYNYRFIGYTRTWKDEMVGDAIEKMYKALEKKLFNLESEFKPFSYFNQIAWHAFTNRINKEKAQHEGLKEYKDMKYAEEMNSPDSQGHVYVRPMMDGDENDCAYDD